MSDSSKGCVLAVFLYSAIVAAFIGSGFLAWEWIEPDSIWTVIGFLIVWGILTKVGYFVVSLIVMGIGSLLGD